MNRHENKTSQGNCLELWDPMMEDYNSRTFNSYRNSYENSFDFEEDELPRNVYVSKIPSVIEKEGLLNIFRQFGKVIRFQLINNYKINKMKYGFIEFSSHSEAQRAILAMNNKAPFYFHASFANRQNQGRCSSLKKEQRQSDYTVLNDFELDVESQVSPTEDDVLSLSPLEDKNFCKLMITFEDSERKVRMVRPLSERPEFQTPCPSLSDFSEFQNGSEFNESSSSHSSGSSRKNSGRINKQMNFDVEPSFMPRKLTYDLDGAGDRSGYFVHPNHLECEKYSASRRVGRGRWEDELMNEVVTPRQEKFGLGKGFSKTNPSRASNSFDRKLTENMGEKPGGGNIHDSGIKNINNNQYLEMQGNILKENSPEKFKDEDPSYFSTQNKFPLIKSQINVSKHKPNFTKKKCSPDKQKWHLCTDKQAITSEEIPEKTVNKHLNVHLEKKLPVHLNTQMNATRLNSSSLQQRPKNKMMQYKESVREIKKNTKKEIKVEETLEKDVGKEIAKHEILKMKEAKPLEKEVRKKMPVKLKSAELSLNQDVYVFVCDSGNDSIFWVQELNGGIEMLKAYSEKLKVMENKLDRNVNLTLGNICAAQFSKDNDWYRARIEKVTHGGVTVFFVDYGNFEETDLDKLAVLPDEFYLLPAQAIKCKVNNSNSNEIIAGKLLWINPVSYNDGIYFINMVDKQEMEVATMSSVKAEPQLQMNSYNSILNDVESSEELKIVVTLHDSDDIWGQLLMEKYILDFAKLLEDISNIENLPDIGSEHVNEGDMIAAKSIEDNNWYRGIVTKNLENSKREVFYIDYGNLEVIEHVKHLPNNMKCVPSLLVHCSVDKVCTPGVKDQLSSLSANDCLYFILKSKRADSLQGDIINSDNVPLALVTLRPWYLVKTNINQEFINGKSSIMTILPSKSQVKTEAELFAPRRLDIGTLYEVFVLFVDDEDIYVGLKSYISEQLKLTEKINAICNKCNDSYIPQVDEIVCAKYPKDNDWYRAKVCEFLNDDHVRVYFIDYGNKEEVLVKNIRSYPRDIICPSFAVKVSLSVVNPERLETIRMFLNEQILMSVVDNNRYPIIVEFFDNERKPLFHETFHKHNDISNDLNYIAIESCVKTNEYENPPSIPNTCLEKTTLNSLSLLTEPLCEKEIYEVLVVSLTNTVTHVCLSNNIHPMMLMCAKLNTYAQENNISYVPTINEIVCARFSEDGSWYRALIQKLNNKFATVMFIDYGNNDDVIFSNIRKLPDFAKSHPAYAVPVLVENFAELKSILKHHEQKLKMKVIVLQDVPVVKLFNESSLSDFELNKSAQACAKIPSQVANAEEVFLNPVITLGDLSFEKLNDNTVEKIVILYIKDPTVFVSFYRRYEDLIKFIRDVSRHCNTVDTQQYKPSVEEVVCAKSNEDGHWYRAVVNNLSNKELHVTFVDFGNSAIAHLEGIRKLPIEFASVPVFAIAVKSEGDTQSLMKNLEQPINMRVLNSSKTPALVEFLDLEHNLASQKTLNDLKKADCVINKSPKPERAQVEMSHSSLPEPADVLLKGRVGTFQCSDLETIVFPLDRVLLTATSIHSPEMIFCNLLNEKNIMAISNLNEEINRYCNDLPASSYKPQKGEMCLAKYSDDNWYRAACLYEWGEKCEVIFVDYGNTEVISSSNLRPMIEEFMQTSQMAMHCCLANIGEKNGWSNEISEKLKTIIPLNEPLEVDVLEKKDSYYIIEIPSLSKALEQNGIIVTQVQTINNISENDQEKLEKLLQEKEEEIRRLRENLKNGSS